MIVAVAGAGLTFLWRRTQTLSQEVRALRAALEDARAQIPLLTADPPPQEISARPDAPILIPPLEAAPLQISARPGLREAFEKLTGAKPMSAPQAMQGQQSTVAASLKPSTPRAPALPNWPAWAWAGFAAGLLAPFTALAFQAYAVSLGLAVALFSLALFQAARSKSVGIAWIGIGACGLWAILALSAGAAQALPIAMPAGLTLLGIAGLAHAGFETNWRPGAFLCACMMAALAALTLTFGVVAPVGIAAGLLVAAAACAGAAHARLDALHLIGFLGAGTLLFALSAQDPDGIWFTPVMGWVGASFLGIAAARAPILGPHGALTASTGSIAPLFVIGGLYATGHGVGQPWMAAAAFASLGVLIAAVLFGAARHAGGIKNLSLTAWVFGAGALVGLTAAIFIVAPLALTGLAFALLTLLLILLHRKFEENLFLFGAALCVVLSLIGAVAALINFNGLPQVLTLHAGLALLGMIGPALLIAVAAQSMRPNAPATHAVLDVGAAACALLAMAALLRALFTAGAPSASPIGLAELGGHALTWLLLALLLLREDWKSARETREIAAGALICAGGAAAAIGFGLWLMGAGPAASVSEDAGLTGYGQHAPMGFALMALGAWLQWDFWRRRGKLLVAQAAYAAACVLSASWIAYEYAWRRPVPLASLDWPTVIVTLLAFSAALVLIGLHHVAQQRYQARLDFHKNLKRHG
jgi:hypothetical protein